MSKYRKKPVVVDADQWFVDDRPLLGMVHGPIPETDVYYIKTLEGSMRVSDGDWIITGVKGQKYPCKPDIFDETYERAEDE